MFTDAHDTVTVEEGDRYPLGPPSYRGMEKVVSRKSHKLQIVGSTPTPATSYTCRSLTTLESDEKRISRLLRERTQEDRSQTAWFESSGEYLLMYP